MGTFTRVWFMLVRSYLLALLGSSKAFIDEFIPKAVSEPIYASNDNGLFTFAFSDASSTIALYDREDPLENERAFRQALTTLYTSFALE